MFVCLFVCLFVVFLSLLKRGIDIQRCFSFLVSNGFQWFLLLFCGNFNGCEVSIEVVS